MKYESTEKYESTARSFFLPCLVQVLPALLVIIKNWLLPVYQNVSTRILRTLELESIQNDVVCNDYMEKRVLNIYKGYFSFP